LERRKDALTVVFIIVGVFFVAVLGIMARSEMKSTERRKVSAFGLSPKKRRTQTLDGTYILK
jgi:hypothetical protein